MSQEHARIILCALVHDGIDAKKLSEKAKQEIRHAEPLAGVAEQSGAGAPETSVRCGAPAATICPNCHDANKYRDYEGPTCDVCHGIGLVAEVSR